jgi:alkylation response protein AidB-like acyl-CoA dehydrogenase
MREAHSDITAIWGGLRPEPGEHPDARRWLEAMASRGWLAPRWSVDYDGGGLSEAEVGILNEEMARIGARPPIFSYGLWMLAPILFEFGTEAQRERFLPPIARGEIRWCQGYSEPGAGSDLAALQTRCEDRGDHWLINGQKIWTSDAHLSDWMFCLVRTDSSRKHDGISFVLIEIASDGVETRPIRLISGASPFCETFFTDVKVPKADMVGPINGGWTIAKRLLQYERQSISGASLAPPEQLHIAARRRLATFTPLMRDRIAGLEMREHAFALTIARATSEAARGGGVSHLSSSLKVMGSLLRQERQELLADANGLHALRWSDDEQDSDPAITDNRSWLRSRSASIEGGTTEINLNIIAKRVLNLPDEGRTR